MKEAGLTWPYDSNDMTLRNRQNNADSEIQGSRIKWEGGFKRQRAGFVSLGRESILYDTVKGDI